ncbi:MAG: hypothetical protein QXG38_03905 [Candidatus Hadarchaeales archaeon]
MPEVPEDPAREKDTRRGPWLDIRPFLSALKKKDYKEAKEWLAEKSAKTGESEFLRGYFLALNGMVSAAESSRELSAIKIILENGRKEMAETLAEEFRKRVSRKFIPEDEAGFMTAWLDFLQNI